jgi:hypothetical protein
VRVVIDFDGSQPGHWSGLLHAEAGLVVDAPFDGRLDLLRLLETLIDNGHDALDDSHNDDDKKEWWR